MKIKIHSSELNRMMKTVVQCIDSRHQSYGNISVIYDNNLLAIRGTNGFFSAVMSTPVLGGDGESFCVDGTMFARVCGMCSGEIEIETDGKVCTIRGAGRTRLPIVNASIPDYMPVNGTAITILADDFARCYSKTAFAISQDQSRMVLTGALLDSGETGIRFVTLDGFKMSIEKTDGSFDKVSAVVPGSFLKLVKDSTYSGDEITMYIGDGKFEARTDGMMINCGLLVGDFPDYDRILPTEFKSECIVKTEDLRTALKSASTVNSANNLVKFAISETEMTVMSNSEQADYEMTIPCQMTGNPLKIAFNQKFMMQVIDSVSSDDAVMKFNLSTSPCVINGKDENGIRLVLPVRVQ